MKITINGIEKEIGRVTRRKLVPVLKEMTKMMQVSWRRSSIVLHDRPIPGWCEVKPPGGQCFKAVLDDEVHSNI